MARVIIGLRLGGQELIPRATCTTRDIIGIGLGGQESIPRARNRVNIGLGLGWQELPIVDSGIVHDSTGPPCGFLVVAH